jgi:hypothetical protein
MFAEIGAQGWVVIIGAIGLVVDRILGYLRERDRSKKLDNIETKVEVVHKATNSLVSKLVQGAEDKGFAAGEKSEKDKSHGG